MPRTRGSICSGDNNRENFSEGWIQMKKVQVIIISNLTKYVTNSKFQLSCTVLEQSVKKIVSW